jgi:hypothetical protein
MDLSVLQPNIQPSGDLLPDRFKHEDIEDILFVITYSGRISEWPSMIWMGKGSHLYSHGERIRLSDSDHGLVQPLCVGLAIVPNSLEAHFCWDAFEVAMRQSTTAIFNTDQVA